MPRLPASHARCGRRRAPRAQVSPACSSCPSSTHAARVVAVVIYSSPRPQQRGQEYRSRAADAANAGNLDADMASRSLIRAPLTKCCGTVFGHRFRGDCRCGALMIPPLSWTAPLEFRACPLQCRQEFGVGQIPGTPIPRRVKLHAEIFVLMAQFGHHFGSEPEFDHDIITVGNTSYLKSEFVFLPDGHLGGSRRPMNPPFPSQRAPRPSGALTSVTSPKRAWWRFVVSEPGLVRMSSTTFCPELLI